MWEAENLALESEGALIVNGIWTEIAGRLWCAHFVHRPQVRPAWRQGMSFVATCFLLIRS